jgi:hypothetical protein
MADKPPEEGMAPYERTLTQADIEAINEIKRLAAHFDSMGELRAGLFSPPVWLDSPPAWVVAPPVWLMRTHGELKRPRPRSSE